MTDLSDIRWRKSSRSGTGNTCVEVARISPVNIAVRDSTDPSGPMLAFDRQEWNAFFEEIKCGTLDLG